MKNTKKESKQLTQAQILKKIEKSGVSSAEQYEMIIQNLQQQSIRLMNDRQQLKIRVDILLEKQKQLMEEQKNISKKSPTVDYTRIKKQLQEKYKQFEVWQKKCYNSINKGALNIQSKNYMNQCTAVQAQIGKYRKILKDEKTQHKKLQKSIRVQLKYMNKNVPQREVLQEQNKQLRRMIWNLRVVQDLTSHVEVRLHNSIVGLNKKKKFIQKLKTMTIQEIRRQQAKSKLQIINQQLKQKKLRQEGIRRLKTQSRISREQLSRLQSKAKSQFIIKQKLFIQKQQEKIGAQAHLATLTSQKTLLQLQQNKLLEKLLVQQKKIAQKNTIIPTQACDVNLQFNQFEDQDPLPLQIIGNQTFILQDDRMILKLSKDTVITGLIVYQNKLGIACIRALYSNGKQTAVLPPQKYLAQKCKQKKVILADQKDYLKWFKAYYDKYQKKIVRIEVYSNNKIKFEVGRQKQLLFKNVLPFKFDNSSYELPVCLRISYQVLQNDWVVSSLGLQINSK